VFVTIIDEIWPIITEMTFKDRSRSSNVRVGSGTLCGFHTYVGTDDMCEGRRVFGGSLYNVDCELYLLLIQWLSTRPQATVTNPHTVLSLGSKETHIVS